MPDENTKQLVLEFVTNAAEASYEVQTLGKNLDDLGDKQQKEAAREKDANEQRTRAAANLRQILEAMLGQLKQMNAALGDVSAASVRTADTAEKAFKKAMVINRALRMEKQRGDREEAVRQKNAQDNFVVEQSRNHDRLRTLKLLAAGGAVIGVGKMAFNMASDIAGRGMAFVNAGALTGVDTKYMQGLNLLIKGRGGAEGAAVQALGALSQTLFNIRRGYANPDKAAAQHLGNAPWRGTTTEFLEYLAERLPQLSPEETVAATAGLGLSPELVALLREAGGREGWRKMMAEAMKNAPDLAKNAESMQGLLANIYAGVDEIKNQALKWLKDIAGLTTPEKQKAFGEALAQGLAIGIVALIMRKQLAGIIAAHPIGAALLAALGIAVPQVKKAWDESSPEERRRAISTGTTNAVRDMTMGSGLDAPTVTPEQADRMMILYRNVWKKIKSLFLSAVPTGAMSPPDAYFRPLGFNLRQFENTIRFNPFNFMGGRDYFNLTHGGGNADNRQFAVNVENINITTRDDPAAVADATQDGLNAAALRLIDRHTAGIYVS